MGGERHLKCFSQERNTMTRPGLEPRPLNPEFSALSIRPLRPGPMQLPPLLGSVILNDPTPVPIIGSQFPIVLPHTLLAMTDLPSFPPGNNEILPQKNLPPPSLLSLTKKG